MFNYGLFIGLVSSVAINRLTAAMHRSKVIYPENVLQADNEYYYWRYRNFFVSFIHASLTGLGSLYCVINTPRLLFDVIETYTEFGYILTSFSFGYFLYDTLEMFTHADYKGTTELIVHHVLILLCFSNTIVFHKYIGYNMIALLIECSNIFLHFRQLLLLSNYPKSGPYYQVNCVINIVLFILIRGGCMFWLWYTLLANIYVIPWITKTIALTAMVGISITTVILFRRVLNSDFIVTGWSISRRKVGAARVVADNKSPPGTNGSTSMIANESRNPSGAEADLYEPMADSLSDGSGSLDSTTISANNSSNGSTIGEEAEKPSVSAYHLRKRIALNGTVPEQVAAAASN